MYRGVDSGASNSSENLSPRGSRERVLLHVYELGAGNRMADAIRGLNAVTKSGFGAGGVFHAAIEVENLSRGLEWSYGYAGDGTGVFAIKATQHPDHTFRETVVLGRTALSREQLLKRLRQMQADWAGESYHLVRCNCISYCKALSNELGVQPLPEWVDRFPRIGAGGLDIAESVAARAILYREAIAASMPTAPSLDVWQIASAERESSSTTPASRAYWLCTPGPAHALRPLWHLVAQATPWASLWSSATPA